MSAPGNDKWGQPKRPKLKKGVVVVGFFMKTPQQGVTLLRQREKGEILGLERERKKCAETGGIGFGQFY